MRIACVEIANFRKLKSVRIDLGGDTTVLVGANNSGKTAAMEALRRFLVDPRFALTDLTLSDLTTINEIGGTWEAEVGSGDVTDLRARWLSVLPRLDVWLTAEEDELHQAQDLLTVLDDYRGGVGVRLQLLPDFDVLKRAYLAKRAGAIEAVEDVEDADEVPTLWPCDLVDYLREEVGRLFKVVPFKLDPNAIYGQVKFGGQLVGRLHDADKVQEVLLQELDLDEVRLKSNPLDRLIQVNVVNAQRGLGSETAYPGRLSEQVSKYYKTHLDFEKRPAKGDLDAIKATQRASDEFDVRLAELFHEPLHEIEQMGYPGSANPRVIIKTVMRMLDGLNHESALMYRVHQPHGANEPALDLPEGLNGLGYQNLVLMMFSLMRYRGDRLRLGKARVTEDGETPPLKPLHLVLVEEPEAHLHAQVQRVFIRRAYPTLTKGLEAYPTLDTQLVVSTHSSHIAQEMDFGNVRYFRRCQSSHDKPVPTTSVRNLISVFGTGSATERFVRRYFKVNHCNLLFADAVVLVEGAAERILLPYFVARFPKVQHSYVEFLDIGGAHAHRLAPLLEELGIPSLVITDLDAVSSADNTKITPVIGAGQLTSNSALDKWLNRDNHLEFTPEKWLDAFVSLSHDRKVMDGTGGGQTRFAYQTTVVGELNGRPLEVLPSTFEDAVALSNLDLFSKHNGIGLLGRFHGAISAATDDATRAALPAALFEALKKSDKAEFALELMLKMDPDAIRVPPYIQDGLAWLGEQISATPLLGRLAPDTEGENDDRAVEVTA